ncbi:MAG: hypothetical protein IJ569_06555 [Prevotella sp.]|nr:hypothetical protein [Prevotella sp.]
MNTLNLDSINKVALYRVTLRQEVPSVFGFYTDFGVEYEIVIKSNDTFIPSGAYALDIINVWQQTSPSDQKFKQTLITIVEEFFRQNNEVMLYVTETKDKKQASRNRLFVRWFNSCEHRDQYLIKAVEGKMNGEMNFMAIISRRDNPRLQQALKEFEETIAFLFD